MRVRFFKIAQNGPNHLGSFCYKFCCQELSKIAQSGPTVTMAVPNIRDFSYPESDGTSQGEGCEEFCRERKPEAEIALTLREALA